MSDDVSGDVPTVPPLMWPIALAMTAYMNAFTRCKMYRCGRTIGHLTVGQFTVTGVPLSLFEFLVSS